MYVGTFFFFNNLNNILVFWSMICTDSSAFRPIFTDLGGIDSVIPTDSSIIRPGFMDLGVLIKNSKSMIHTGFN